MGEILLLILPGAIAALLHRRLNRGNQPKYMLLWLGYGYGISMSIYLLKGLWSGKPLSRIGENFASVHEFVFYGATAILLTAVLPVIIYMITGKHPLTASKNEGGGASSASGKAWDGRLSAIRLTATVLVVFCHILEQGGVVLQNSILHGVGNYCSVGVPMFLLLSGYLYGQREYECFAQRVHVSIYGMKKVLLDYYVYAFLFIMPLYCILAPETISFQAVVNTLLGRFGFPKLVHFWYIPYALFCYMITPFLYDLKKAIFNASQNRLSVFICFTLLLLILVSVLSKVYKGFFKPVYLCCYIIGFFLPDMLDWRKEVFNIKQLLLRVMPFCLVFNSCKIYLKNIAAVEWEGVFGIMQTLLYDIAHLLLGLCLFAAVYLIYAETQKRRPFTESEIWLLKKSDRYSFDLYIVHMLYVKGVLSVMQFTSSFFLNVLCALFLTVCSAVILKWVCDRISNTRKANICGEFSYNQGNLYVSDKL